MSRSGYSDDIDNWQMIMWRGCVASAIRGRRGQRLLRDLADALDAMPTKRLIAGAIEHCGDYCALGVAGVARGVALDQIDPEDHDQVAATFDIADALAREIAGENDDGGPRNETPTQRWTRMRAWVAEHLREALAP